MDWNSSRATEIDPGLLAAYRAADYHVTGASPRFVMHVDEPSFALAALHAEFGSSCSALLTACNPAGEQRGDEENEAAMRRLTARLADTGTTCLDAYGADPIGQWPAEPSVLALGLGRDAALALAGDFGQNAILWAGADAIPRLLLLR